MEKTLQEKAEKVFIQEAISIAHNNFEEDERYRIQVCLQKMAMFGYNFHAQESKTMEDKYKKVVGALENMLWAIENRDFKLNTSNFSKILKQAESVLNSLKDK